MNLIQISEYQHPDVIKTLEILLEDAKAGRLTGAALAVRYGQWHRGAWLAGDFRGDIDAAIEAVERLAIMLGAQRAHAHDPAIEAPMIYEMVVDRDRRTRITRTNDGIRRYFRLSPDAVARDSNIMASVIHPEDLPGLITAVMRVSKTGGHFLHRYRTRFPDGSGAHLLSKAHVRLLPEGGAHWHGVITPCPASPPPPQIKAERPNARQSP